MWIHGSDILANKPSLDILAALKAKDATESIWRSKQVCYSNAMALLREQEETVEETEETLEVFPSQVDDSGNTILDEAGQPVPDTTKAPEIQIQTVSKIVRVSKEHTWKINDQNYFVVSDKNGNELGRWELELVHSNN